MVANSLLANFTMSDTSKIEWTDATWNPVRGCSIVSKGCTNCYAMKQARRFSGAGGPYDGLTRMTRGGPVWSGKVRLVPELLNQPLRWRKPRRIFVNSMSDLFHEDVPDEFIDKVFAVMGTCHWHTFQVLTKRPQRMLGWFSERWQPAPEQSQRDLYEAQVSLAKRCGINAMPAFHLDTTGEDRFDQVYAALDSVPRCVDTDDDRLWANGKSNVMARAWPFHNVWLGVSVEDQAAADERIPLLLQTPATMRWISAEPLLGPIDLDSAQVDGIHALGCGDQGCNCGNRGLDWVVTGGESGPKARASHPDWFRSLRDQCKAAGVPFFFKQWGEWAPIGTLEETKAAGAKRALLFPALDYCFLRVGKKASGRQLDDIEHNEYPASPFTTTKEPQ